MKKNSRSDHKHKVNATLAVHGLTKVGTSLDLEIYADGEKIGQITIGRGSLMWTGAHRQKGKRISWSRFAKQMDQIVYGD